MKREFLQNLTVDGQSLSKEIIDAIMAENGRDIQQAKQSGADWEEKYNKAVADHKRELDELSFRGIFSETVRSARGRNEKAIAALLDLETIRSAEDPQRALTDAVAELKKDSGYLFENEEVPPYFAAGTGVRKSVGADAPVSLAGALRARFETGRGR